MSGQELHSRPGGPPVIFIGSSQEERHLVDELADLLRESGEVEVIPWYDAFRPGFSTLEQLVDRIEEVDFAAFFLLPEDERRMRDEAASIPRDNLVFELGLFMGRLNRSRAFALVEEGKDVALFSDYRGITEQRFSRTDIPRLSAQLLAHMRAGRAPRQAPGVHLVDRRSYGRNVHDSIASALAAAKADDVILVRPGTYVEPLIIDKPVEIVGVGVVGRDVKVAIRVEGSSAVVYDSPGTGKLASLWIETDGTEDDAALEVLDGDLLVRGCDITSRGSAKACVHIRGTGRLGLTSNRIVDGLGAGVIVSDHGDATIADNKITGHAHSCVEVRDATRPEIVGNRIGDGQAGGVWFHAKAGGLLQRNDIYENEQAGVAIQDGAAPRVRVNRIHHGKHDGVYVASGARPTIEDNEITQNDGTGVVIDTDGEPKVVDNRIHHGRGGGILMMPGARGRILENEVRANERAGVTFEAGSRPSSFNDNMIIHNAVGVYDASGVEQASNTVIENGENWVTASRVPQGGS